MQIFHSLSQLERRSCQFFSRIVRPLFTSWTNWNNRKYCTLLELLFSSDVFVGVAVVVAKSPYFQVPDGGGGGGVLIQVI